MGKGSAIEWTDHTFNPWTGCTKASDGCKHCYAETLSNRKLTNAQKLPLFGTWGPKGIRKPCSESQWMEVFKWQRSAEKAKRFDKVFCGSLCDIFEGEETCTPEAFALMQRQRTTLFTSVITRTPNLIWLLLTKRPENVLKLVPPCWLDADTPNPIPGYPALKWWPQNVWIGTSVENQEVADKRIPKLLEIPAPVRFLSCEPLLGPVNLSPLRCHGHSWQPDEFDESGDVPTCECGREATEEDWLSGIHWVIAGGESGPKARPMHPDWVRTLQEQCNAAKVPFLFKQWGEYLPFEDSGQAPFWLDQTGVEWDGHGLNIIDPETSDIGKGWHEASMYESCAWKRVGKKAAGRLLDGRTWDEMPEVPHA